MAHEHLRRIVIGNPLKSSPDFPPLCTECAAFTALGAPSNSDVRASNTTYTLRYSFISCCSEVNTGTLSFRFGFSLSYSKLCLLCLVFLFWIRLVAVPPPLTYSRLHRYHATTLTGIKNGYCPLTKVFPSNTSQAATASVFPAFHVPIFLSWDTFRSFL